MPNRKRCSFLLPISRNRWDRRAKASGRWKVLDQDACSSRSLSLGTALSPLQLSFPRPQFATRQPPAPEQQSTQLLPTGQFIIIPPTNPVNNIHTGYHSPTDLIIFTATPSVGNNRYWRIPTSRRGHSLACAAFLSGRSLASPTQPTGSNPPSVIHLFRPHQLSYSDHVVRDVE